MIGRYCARCISTLLRFGAAVTVFFLVISLLAGTLSMAAAGFRIAFFPHVAVALGTAAALQLVDYRLVLYQIEEKPVSYLTLAAACFGLTAAATAYRVILLRDGALGLLGGKLTGAVLTLCLALWLGRHWLDGGWEKSFVREALPLSLPLVPHFLLALGLVAADRLILLRYRSMEEVGLVLTGLHFWDDDVPGDRIRRAGMVAGVLPHGQPGAGKATGDWTHTVGDPAAAGRRGGGWVGHRQSVHPRCSRSGGTGRRGGWSRWSSALTYSPQSLRFSRCARCTRANRNSCGW